MARNAAAAHSQATMSLSPLTCQFTCRPTPARIISTKITNTQEAASAPAASYRRSRKRRTAYFFL